MLTEIEQTCKDYERNKHARGEDYAAHWVDLEYENQTDSTDVILHQALPHEMHDTYIEWLNEVHGIDPIDIPKGRSKTCKPGLGLPKPSGSRWREMIDSKLNKNDRALEARHTRHLIDYALTTAL